MDGKWMRRLFAVVTAFCLAMSLGGCNVVRLVRKVASESVETVTGVSGRYQLDIPGDWVEQDAKELNELSDIIVSDLLNQKMVMVLPESKEDFDTSVALGDYADMVWDLMDESMDDPDFGAAESVTLDGRDALSRAVSGTVNGTKLQYFVYITETADDFVRVMGWTALSKGTSNREELENVMRTFRTVD